MEAPVVGIHHGYSLLDRISPAALAWAVDAALLNPTATEAELEHRVAECLKLGVKGLCVLPRHLRTARRLVDEAGGGLDIIGVVDFPLGARTTAQKIAEIA